MKTKRPFILRNSLKATLKPQPRNVRWKFVRPSRSATTVSYDRHPMPGSYTRANPFPAKVAVNRSLCGEGSEKDTRHFELDLTGWGLNYEVGDSMTVWPTNDAALGDEIIKIIGAKGDEEVKGPNGTKPLREVLVRDCRIPQTSPKF